MQLLPQSYSRVQLCPLIVSPPPDHFFKTSCKTNFGNFYFSCSHTPSLSTHEPPFTNTLLIISPSSFLSVDLLLWLLHGYSFYKHTLYHSSAIYAHRLIDLFTWSRRQWARMGTRIQKYHWCQVSFSQGHPSKCVSLKNFFLTRDDYDDICFSSLLIRHTV